jgi:hypothetical protein
VLALLLVGGLRDRSSFATGDGNCRFQNSAHIANGPRLSGTRDSPSRHRAETHHLRQGITVLVRRLGKRRCISAQALRDECSTISVPSKMIIR